MAFTKQQIFDAMQPKKKLVPNKTPIKQKDNFADLVSRLKAKEKPPVNPD